jgi:hypothetical protein
LIHRLGALIPRGDHAAALVQVQAQGPSRLGSQRSEPPPLGRAPTHGAQSSSSNLRFDAGLSEFIRDILLSENRAVAAASAAFRSSYSATKTKNSFTKVQMALEADTVLQEYFTTNIHKIEAWFNVIAPERQNVGKLQAQIAKLSKKNWPSILEA